LKGQPDAFTKRPGDLPEGGDERLKDIEQVVLKLYNLPEQLDILANNISVHEHSSIGDLFNGAFEVDLLPDQILKAI
jgi:hypothetical protein